MPYIEVNPTRLELDYEHLLRLSTGNPTLAVRNWVLGFFIRSGQIQIDRVRLIHE